MKTPVKSEPATASPAPAQAIGEDTVAVLAEIGIEPAEIERLAQEGVIQVLRRRRFDDQKARAEQTINQPADVVWARIGKFDDISWVPNTDTCTVVDGVRTITMKGMDGFELKQWLVEQNDETRTLRYELAKEFDLSVGLRARQHRHHGDRHAARRAPG